MKAAKSFIVICIGLCLNRLRGSENNAKEEKDTGGR